MIIDLGRIDRTRLARASAKLDSEFEKRMAEEGLNELSNHSVRCT